MMNDLVPLYCTWDEFLGHLQTAKVSLIASDDLGGHFGFVDKMTGTWYLIPIHVDWPTHFIVR